MILFRVRIIQLYNSLFSVCMLYIVLTVFCCDWYVCMYVQFGYSSAPGVVRVVQYSDFSRAHEHHMVSGNGVTITFTRIQTLETGCSPFRS